MSERERKGDRRVQVGTRDQTYGENDRHHHSDLARIRTRRG